MSGTTEDKPKLTPSEQDRAREPDLIRAANSIVDYVVRRINATAPTCKSHYPEHLKRQWLLEEVIRQLQEKV